MTNAHLTTIVLTLIIFFITLTLQRKGRNIKVHQMILRVMYLLIILTGVMLFFSLYEITMLFTLKSILGLALIGVFEVILSAHGKGRNAAAFWILLSVVILVTIYLGLKLPLGIYMFN